MSEQTAASAATETIYLGMGCFWGVEKVLKALNGVTDTEVGYMGGTLPNPTYQRVCEGDTGHAEVVRVRYNGQALAAVLKFFFEQHDPTQLDRQGADVGKQYRSLIFTTTDEQYDAACQLREKAQEALSAKGFGQIVSQLYAPSELATFWPAEEYHQDYLEKNPAGYCPIHATGIQCG